MHATRPPSEQLLAAEYDLAAAFSPFLGDTSLDAAVLHMTTGWTTRTGIPVRVEVEGSPRRTAADGILLRLVQEALENVDLHSCAERAVVTVGYPSGGVHVSVLDDGRGFDQTVTHPGSAIRDLGERLAEFDGTICIEAVPGHGCLVEATLPSPEASHRASQSRRHGARSAHDR